MMFKHMTTYLRMPTTLYLKIMTHTWHRSFYGRRCLCLRLGISYGGIFMRNWLWEKIYLKEGNALRMCHLFGEQNETMDHLFLKCHFPCTIWFDTALSYMMDIDPHTSFTSWREYWLRKRIDGSIELERILYMNFILWHIWKTRNEKMFR